MLISIQWGIIRVEFGELSLPSLLALRDCVDYQGDICETCENLNYCLDIFHILWGLFLFPHWTFHLLSFDYIISSTYVYVNPFSKLF
nr:MAG TPA: hypothetical protein [Caudoviricetes sp.]